MIRKLLLTAAFFVFLAATPAAAQYNAKPTLTVDPLVAEVGDTVSVTLAGCGLPDGTEIPVFIDDVEVGVGTLIGGTFTIDVVVPDEAGGVLEVEVEAACESATDDEVKFGVLSASLAIQPPTLPFQPPTGGTGGDLARTGGNALPVAQVGAGLIGLGALALVLALRRNDDDRPLRQLPADV